jgi:hypothetical protein
VRCCSSRRAGHFARATPAPSLSAASTRGNTDADCSDAPRASRASAQPTRLGHHPGHRHPPGTIRGAIIHRAQTVGAVHRVGAKRRFFRESRRFVPTRCSAPTETAHSRSTTHGNCPLDATTHGNYPLDRDHPRKLPTRRSAPTETTHSTQCTHGNCPLDRDHPRELPHGCHQSAGERWIKTYSGREMEIDVERECVGDRQTESESRARTAGSRKRARSRPGKQNGPKLPQKFGPFVAGAGIEPATPRL